MSSAFRVRLSALSELQGTGLFGRAKLLLSRHSGLGFRLGRSLALPVGKTILHNALSGNVSGCVACRGSPQCSITAQCG